ncbi:retrovirus-related pol polyprotein from transposon TNT 1-94 [Tanacetum coccineum]
MDACDQVHSEGISLQTTVMAQQFEITELQATDRRRQSVITNLLKADYRRQRHLVETLKIVKSLKTQMIELQRQQGPAKDPTEPELQQQGPAKDPYELLSGKVPNISHLKLFGCHVTILNTSDHLGKFEGKANEGFLVGYFAHSKAYRVYNLSNKKIEETLNLRYMEDKPNVQGLGHEWYFDLTQMIGVRP